jgi:hypothetical protein
MRMAPVADGSLTSHSEFKPPENTITKNNPCGCSGRKPVHRRCSFCQEHVAVHYELCIFWPLQTSIVGVEVGQFPTPAYGYRCRRTKQIEVQYAVEHIQR